MHMHHGIMTLDIHGIMTLDQPGPHDRARLTGLRLSTIALQVPCGVFNVQISTTPHHASEVPWLLTSSPQAVAAATQSPAPQPQVLTCEELETHMFQKAAAFSSQPAAAAAPVGAMSCAEFEAKLFATAAGSPPQPTLQAAKATAAAVASPQCTAPSSTLNDNVGSTHAMRL